MIHPLSQPLDYDSSLLSCVCVVLIVFARHNSEHDPIFQTQLEQRALLVDENVIQYSLLICTTQLLSLHPTHSLDTDYCCE